MTWVLAPGGQEPYHCVPSDQHNHTRYNEWLYDIMIGFIWKFLKPPQDFSFNFIFVVVHKNDTLTIHSVAWNREHFKPSRFQWNSSVGEDTALFHPSLAVPDFLLEASPPDPACVPQERLTLGGDMGWSCLLCLSRSVHDLPGPQQWVRKGHVTSQFPPLLPSPCWGAVNCLVSPGSDRARPLGTRGGLLWTYGKDILN